METCTNKYFGTDLRAMKNWSNIHPGQSREEALEFIRDQFPNLDSEEILRSLIGRELINDIYLPVFNRTEWERASTLGFPLKLIEREEYNDDDVLDII